MTDLERLVVEEDGTSLLAWNETTVFRGEKQKDGRWLWRVATELTPEAVKKEKQIHASDAGVWKLTVTGGGGVTVVKREPSHGKELSRSLYRCPTYDPKQPPDLSRAIRACGAIWYPDANDVMWVNVVMAERQQMLKPWAVAAVALASAFTIWLAFRWRQSAGAAQDSARTSDM